MTPEEIAQALRAAEENNEPIAPIREHIANAQIAYQIQDINTKHRLDKGGRLVGRKVGLTNPAVQKQLGVNQPDYGMLFADMDIMYGSTLAWNEATQFKVEAEIAFILGRDLTDPQASSAEMIRAIEYAVPAIEIVASRIANWDIQFVDTVADNGSSAFFTLGPSPRKLENLDLTGCKMQMQGSDGSVSEGVGAACYGSPLNAALWLVRVMAQTDYPLCEGDIILSGALGPMINATAGARYVAQIEGFGDTAIEFGV